MCSRPGERRAPPRPPAVFAVRVGAGLSTVGIPGSGIGSVSTNGVVAGLFAGLGSQMTGGATAVGAQGFARTRPSSST